MYKSIGYFELVKTLRLPSWKILHMSWCHVQVEMYVIAGENVEIANGIGIEKGERVLMEISRKFLTEQLRGLAYHCGFYFQVKNSLT